jgi:hypothetical protein
MENATQSRVKRIQLLLTIGLAVVLFALVAGYVYYGMQLAKQGSDTTPAVVDEKPADSAKELTTEEKMQILDSLAKDAPSTTLSATEKQAALDNLTESSEPQTMTEAQKKAILDDLQNPQPE